MTSFRHCLETADGIERRNQRRYPITAQVALTVTAGEQDHVCVVEDVSLGGMRVLFDEPIELDAEVEFSHPRLGRFRGLRRWTAKNAAGISVENEEAAVRICVHCLKKMVPAKGAA